MARITPIAKFTGPRHRTIADLADGLLKDKARKEILKLLKKIKVTKLEQVATWADQIKTTTPPKDKETKNFLDKFPKTREWHFVDLPIDASGYDVDKYKPFVRDDDIVHIAVESINILTGQSTKFSKLNAIRWLVHLVGDMHQPLHLACSYIDASGTKPRLVFEAEEILKKNLLQKSDKGGNNILLPLGRNGTPLHSYWDGDLPARDNNFKDFHDNPPAVVPVNKLNMLPPLWVSENVKFAKQAYTGLTVKGKNADNPRNLDVTFIKDKYDSRCIPIIKTLSETAASRLAFLLNTIFG